MNSIFSYSLFITLLYFFIYDPPFAFLGGIRLSYIFIVLSLLYVSLYNYKQWWLYFRLFQTELCFFSIVVCFSFVRSGIMGDYMYIVRHILSLLYIIAVIPILLTLSKKLGITTENKMIKGILVTSSIAGCISLACVVIPPFNDIVKNVIIQYQEEDYLYGKFNRGFGIANGLTSSYGYIQGTIVALGLMYLKENKWFLFFIPVVFFSALINARTGVLMTFWGCIVLFFSKNKKTLFPIIALTIGFIYYLKDIMSFIGFNEYTIAWILDFQDQLKELYSGNYSTGTTSKMFKMVWPQKEFEWIVGRGVDLFRFKTSAEHSDMGWLIQLNYGGFLYIIPLYGGFLFMVNRLFNKNLHFFAYLFLGVVIICNTKSKIFPTTSFFPLLVLIYYVVISKMRPFISRMAEIKNKDHIRLFLR